MKEIALHILDIAQNSVAAGASEIRITVQETKRLLKIRIADDGCGMDPEGFERATDPFFTTRTTRRVGLGIPLLKQHAEMTGGRLTIGRGDNKGTLLEATFRRGHPDLQPLGDLEGCFVLLAASCPEIEWVLECRSTLGSFRVSTREIKKVLEVEVIRGKELTGYLKQMIRNNLESIQLGRVLIENRPNRYNFKGTV